MDIHENENLVHSASHKTSCFDSILQEPPTAKPPVQAPKPDFCLVPDFNSVNFSVTSDASEFDYVDLPNNVQNGITKNYLPSSEFNKMSTTPPFSYFNAKPTNVHRGNQNYGRKVQEPASGMFHQSAEDSFSSNISGTSTQSIQNFASSKAYLLSNNLSRTCMLEKNGEYSPEFSMMCQMNSPFSSDYQNVRAANINFENRKIPYEPQGLPNILNQSNSVTLLPQQLHFPDSITAVNANDTSNSKHMSETDLSPLHSTKVYKNIRKHHNLDGRGDKSVRPKYQQEPQLVDSNPTGFCNDINAKENIPNDIWTIRTILHDQNERIKQLQNQVIAYEQQSNAAAVSKQTAVQLSDDKRLEIINENLKNVLRYITEHNNTILELKDQVSILAKRTEELESKSRNSISEPLDFSRTGASSNAETNNTPNNSYSKDDVMCRKETHVKMTSSSTMTSVTLDGSEKLLFRKTTVVTENCQNATLLQHPQNKNSADNGHSENHYSGEAALNGNYKCATTPKSLDSKKPRKSKGIGKSNGGCENVTPKGDQGSPVTQAVKLSKKCHPKHSSPLSDFNKADQNINTRRSPGEINLTNFPSVLENIDNFISRDSEDEKSSEKHSGSCSIKIRSCAGKSAAKQNFRAHKSSGASAYPCTSEDSDYASPNSGWTDEDDSAKKIYGIPTSLMSVDTQQYLEKHSLCDNKEKLSSKKLRSPHFKQHLR